MVGIDMAIVIPSSKTYDRQNPKVRDNIIERIEVGAVEVLPNNEYETPVYNEKFSSFELIDTSGDPDKKDVGLKAEYKYTNIGSTNSSTVAFVAYCGYQSYKKSSFSLTIPRLKRNSFLNSIMYGEDKDGNANIKYNVYCSKRTGNAEGTFIYGGSYDGFTGCTNIVLKEGKLEDTKNYSLPKEVSYTYSGTNSSAGLSGSATANAKMYEGESIVKATPTYEENQILINFDIISKVTVVKLGTNPVVVASGNFLGKGSYEEYIPKQIEITIYGNTIGIDLTDKTIYIPENDTVSKKVHSVDGNELMQTSNYLLDTGKNAIETMYGETRLQYEKGKETATVLCSIGDYFDNESGEKVVSIDNSTGKMSFDIYDKVIPMVYTRDGTDKPMSYKPNGDPKVFQVLGSKIYYDGAVWQELSLQEFD
jgi:hypothetical protein